MTDHRDLRPLGGRGRGLILLYLRFNEINYRFNEINYRFNEINYSTRRRNECMHYDIKYTQAYRFIRRCLGSWVSLSLL